MPDPTLKTVAGRAGVNVGTASRALDPNRQWQVRPQTRARVLVAAEQLNYRPHALARGLRSGKSLTAGLVVADLGNPFVAPLIRGFSRAVKQHGLLAINVETEDDSTGLRSVVEDLLNRRVDALAITAIRLGDRPFISELIRQQVPLVLASRPLPELDVPTVVHDSLRAGFLAAEHLHQLGHCVVGMIKGSDDIQSFLDRGAAFRENAQRLGMTVLEVGCGMASDYLRDGHDQMEMILGRGPTPTGVFAENDLMAVGAIDAIREAGLRCPEDISVVGHDDVPLADHLDPSLTTIHTRGDEVGRLAGEMLAAMLGGAREPPQSVVLVPRLVARRSTGPAPVLAR